MLTAQEISLLQTLAWPVPVLGYPLQNEFGEIVAEADLAWPEQKRALIFEDEASAAPFTNCGWTVVVGPISQETLQSLSGGKE